MPKAVKIKPDLADRIRSILGPAGVVTDPDEARPHVTDWRGRYHGVASLVAKPSTTAEVAAVVRICAEAGVPIVPQGGNTGLVGGGVPGNVGNEVVVCLSRMNRIRSVDPHNNTMTVEAGCILSNVQTAAAEADRLFPLSLAAEGSCQIGGNLSTNAGGVAVLRYGNMRDLVLGLEVVLPDGRVWNGLRGLRKDNTGYDLKQLFIGAEGTLGIITAAVIKLYPKPKSVATFLVALKSPAAAVSLLNSMRTGGGDRLTGFELFSRVCLDLVLQHIPHSRDPFSISHPWYVLAELSDTSEGGGLNELAEKLLSGAIESGLAIDVVMAENSSQKEALWSLRENISEAQRAEGISIKHDVSVPVSCVAPFIAEASTLLEQRFPGVRIVAFGHVGDGNIHFNLSRPLTRENEAFIAQTPEVNRIVHDTVAAYGGSISAEHGLGQLKRDEIKRYKSAIELELMRAIKQALDPRGLMNPGKVL